MFFLFEGREIPISTSGFMLYSIKTQKRAQDFMVDSGKGSNFTSKMKRQNDKTISLT
jgi:hypothetical protein